MANQSGPSQNDFEKKPKHSVPQTSLGSTVSTQMLTMFTDPDFFVQGD